MKSILQKLFGVNKRQFLPRRNPRSLTLFEALDTSLKYGFDAVNWEAINA